MRNKSKSGTETSIKIKTPPARQRQESKPACRTASQIVQLGNRTDL
nr:MAG TPA: hypothetical protein [Caudoviricetes sp.]